MADTSNKEKNGINVIVGCDGAGSLKRSRIGSREMAKSWCRYLHSHADEVMEMQIENAKIRMAEITRKTLERLSRIYRCQTSEFGSTVISVVVNEKNNKWMSFHLGDGMILKKPSNDTCYEILSMPRNGILLNQTYLTSIDALEENIRVKRGDMTNIDSFAIMTDGVYNCPLNILNLSEKADKLIKDEIDMQPGEDDQGLAVLYRI